jgi:hypothetical protein
MGGIIRMYRLVDVKIICIIIEFREKYGLEEHD